MTSTPLPLNSISVIVPCAGWPATLPACLASLAAQTVAVPVEIVVVVNGPDRNVAPASWPGVTIVHEPVRGPAAARNAGARAAHGDILAFTDSDCVADPSWLAGASAAIRHDAAGSVVAGAITRSGATLNAVSFYDSVTFLQQEAYVKWSHAFVTANMVVHRSVFDRIGPFDLAFNEAAFEDWDWALRARRANIAICYASQAPIDHPCMSSLRELKSKSHRLARGEIVFRRKYGRRPRSLDLFATVWSHAHKAWRHEQPAILSRARLAVVGALAGFWRWQACRQILRTKSGRSRNRMVG